mmetsp:Transcript_47603/g.121475  ORF Transcript_47603/g.121475 Transcript_47603/m.121475 type:complete len:276 (+) Transcript_47603:449-1276(+)
MMPSVAMELVCTKRPAATKGTNAATCRITAASLTKRPAPKSRMAAASAELVTPTTAPVSSRRRPRASGRCAGRPIREGRKDWHAMDTASPNTAKKMKTVKATWCPPVPTAPTLVTRPFSTVYIPTLVSSTSPTGPANRTSRSTTAGEGSDARRLSLQPQGAAPSPGGCSRSMAATSRPQAANCAATVAHAAPRMPIPKTLHSSRSPPRLSSPAAKTLSIGVTGFRAARKKHCSTEVTSAATSPSARICTYCVAGPTSAAPPAPAMSAMHCGAKAK